VRCWDGGLPPLAGCTPEPECKGCPGQTVKHVMGLDTYQPKGGIPRSYPAWGFSLKVAARYLPSSLEQSVLIGSIPCANASLVRRSVSAGKTGTVILRAKMLDWIIAIGDRIRAGRSGRCELRSAGANNDAIGWIQDRLYRLQRRRRTSAGRDPAAIRRLARGKCDQRK
jgi:hypothetical protein